jgi:hypothetical protein
MNGKTMSEKKYIYLVLSAATAGLLVSGCGGQQKVVPQCTTKPMNYKTLKEIPPRKTFAKRVD